jgi:hypothetical protein
VSRLNWPRNPAASSRSSITVPSHNPLEEWVYNRASIDAAPVVWARELDDAGNRSLIEYFHDRRAWRIDAETVPARISPY